MGSSRIDCRNAFSKISITYNGHTIEVTQKKRWQNDSMEYLGRLVCAHGERVPEVDNDHCPSCQSWLSERDKLQCYDGFCIACRDAATEEFETLFEAGEWGLIPDGALQTLANERLHISDYDRLFFDLEEGR